MPRFEKDDRITWTFDPAAAGIVTDRGPETFVGTVQDGDDTGWYRVLLDAGPGTPAGDDQVVHVNEGAGLEPFTAKPAKK